MKNEIGFILFVVAVLGLLLLLSTSKKYPPLPKDNVHAPLSRDAECSACHGPGQANQLKPGHPPKFECMKCHNL